MDEKIDILVDWFNGKKAPPYMLELRLTSRCNLKCLSCWQRNPKRKKTDYNDELKEERYVELVKEAAMMGIRVIQIVGDGEPMCRPKTTISIMNLIKKYGMRGFLITNGTLFSEEIIKNLIKIRWDEIAFSLDASDSETNDYLRGFEGAYHKCVTTMRLFQYWKRKLKSTKPEICIFPVLSNQNYDKIPEMIDLACNLEVERVHFQPLYVETKLAEKLMLTEEQRSKLPNYIKTAQKIAIKHNLSNNLNDFLDEKVVEKSGIIGEVIKSDIEKHPKNSVLSIPCFIPWFYIGLRVDGQVGPCPIPVKSEESIKQKTLSEVWYGDYFNKIRGRLKDGNLLRKCKKCCGGNVLETRRIRNILKSVMNGGRELE